MIIKYSDLGKLGEDKLVSHQETTAWQLLATLTTAF